MTSDCEQVLKDFMTMLARRMGLAYDDTMLQIDLKMLAEIPTAAELMAALERTYANHQYGQRLPLAFEILQHWHAWRTETMGSLDIAAEALTDHFKKRGILIGEAAAKAIAAEQEARRTPAPEDDPDGNA